MAQITLYDEACNFPERSISPNVAKVRFALNFKGLAFKTVFVEFVDLPAIYEHIQAKPIGAKYTLPVLHDASTGMALANSLDIALYLDAAYPDTRRVVPEGTEPFHALLTDAFGASVAGPLSAFVFPASFPYLNPAGQRYFLESGRVPEVLSGDARIAKWAEVKEGLAAFDKYIGAGREWFTGDSISYADFILAGDLRWAKVVLEKEEWDELASWNGGRWGRLVAEIGQFDQL
ncbi:Glutathione transferase fungal specific class A [Mycena kentingensis (nom. inval.)]|nr:Glutathione transferase fungal specific class A [Mycena kentingensis (nom. inval.)]